ALLLLAGCTPSPKGDGTIEPLIFMAIPSQRPGPLEESFQPVLRMLEHETGRKIRFREAHDYAEVIEGVRTGKVQIAELGPFSYVLAKHQGARITAVVARVTQQGDLPKYQSYGITRADSSISTLADFRGKKICFVDENSASGYLYPKAALLDVGISVERDVDPQFMRAHDLSGIAVATGQCDAGFAYNAIMDLRLLEQKQIKPGEIKVVWRSDPIPSGPLVILESLPAKLRDQMVTALQKKSSADYLRANGFCEGACLIADGFSYGFGPLDDAAYDGVREVCRKVGEKSCEKA
uniref:phosphate/phosphite/phosphonate ABC transporter substrate-binding protein n=1 Tax=Frankia sp. Cr1 TaxID=3073931 RepID=UPI002AD27EAC